MVRYTTVVLIILISVLSVVTRAQSKDEKHVFVTALDRDGTPIVGLKAEHFAIRESGRDRDVLSVEPLRTPMHLAVLVDTSVANGAPDETFRAAVLAFIDRVAPGNHVALYSFGDRATRVAPFSQDPAQVRSAASGMFGWGHQRALLIDTIDLALRDFENVEAARPVIVAIGSESPEASGKTAGGVIRRLIAQSVAFHSISVTSSPGPSTAGSAGGDVPAKSRQLGGMIAAGEGDRERTQLLEQGTSATGGGRQRVTSLLALPNALGRIASEFANSYKVTFARPGAAKMQDLQVGLLVDGVTLRATAAPFGTR
jgi:VWFA-related protein